MSLAVCVQKIMTFWIFFLPDFIISSSMEIVLERMGWDYLIFSLAREHSLTSKGEVSLYGWPPVWLVWIWPNLLIWIIIQHKQSSWIQTSQTVGQPYSDTFPNAGLPRAKYTEIEHHIFSLASYGFHLSCNKFMLAYNIFDSIQVCNSFEKASYLLLFKFD